MLDYLEIPLYDKNGIIGYTKVDPDDYEIYSNWRWNISHGYAKSRNRLIHRLIMNAKDGEIIDHLERCGF